MYFAHKLEVTCRKLNLNNQFKGSWPKSQKSTKKAESKRVSVGMVLGATGERQTVWQFFLSTKSKSTKEQNVKRWCWVWQGNVRRSDSRSALWSLCRLCTPAGNFFSSENSIKSCCREVLSWENLFKRWWWWWWPQKRWRPHSSRAHRSHQQRQHRRWCTF